MGYCAFNGPSTTENKEHRPRGNDLGKRSQEQPMKIGSNKAFEVIGTKACLNLNANVGLKK